MFTPWPFALLLLYTFGVYPSLQAPAGPCGDQPLPTSTIWVTVTATATTPNAVISPNPAIDIVASATALPTPNALSTPNTSFNPSAFVVPSAWTNSSAPSIPNAFTNSTVAPTLNFVTNSAAATSAGVSLSAASTGAVTNSSAATSTVPESSAVSSPNSVTNSSATTSALISSSAAATSAAADTVTNSNATTSPVTSSSATTSAVTSPSAAASNSTVSSSAQTATSSTGPSGIPATPSMWSVVYDDRSDGNGTANVVSGPAEIAGYNVYVLGFWTTYAPAKYPGTLGGPMDSLSSWISLSPSERTALRQNLHDAGIAVTVSMFGSLDDSTDWISRNYTGMAQEVAELVKMYDLDGVDIDFEDLSYAANNPADTKTFLSAMTLTLRQELPAPYIISHSVQVRWWCATGVDDIYANNPTSVSTTAGHAIDYYATLYYDSVGYWDTCPTLMEESAIMAGVAVEQVLAGGEVPANKMVVAMPESSAYGLNAFADGVGTNFGQCLNGKSYGGVATWRYDPAYSQWITNIRTAAGW